MFHNKRNSRIVYFTDQIYQNVYFTDRSDFTKNACISEKKNDINFKFGTMIDINDSICFIATKFTDRIFYRPDLRKYPFYRPVCKIHTCQVIFFSPKFAPMFVLSKQNIVPNLKSKRFLDQKLWRIIKILTLLCKIHTRHKFEFKLCRWSSFFG